MSGFTKLHGAIVHSSIWSEPLSVRVVWITMLAMANQNGMVEASESGLARAANVTREECAQALEILTGPDAESRDGTTGERVERVTGGFFVINYANYRDYQTEQQVLAAERAKAYRANKREMREARTKRDASRTSRTVTRDATEAEAEAEADKKSASKSRRAIARPDSVPDEAWEDWQAVRKAKRAGPITNTVIARMQIEADKARISLADAVTEAASRGWQAFRADWIESKQSKDRAAGRHIPNTPLGTASCNCQDCHDYRKKRDRQRGATSGTQGIGDVLGEIVQGRAS